MAETQGLPDFYVEVRVFRRGREEPLSVTKIDLPDDWRYRTQADIAERYVRLPAIHAIDRAATNMFRPAGSGADPPHAQVGDDQGYCNQVESHS